MFNQFARYEDTFQNWRRDGMPGLKPESYKYIEFLASENDDRIPPDGTLWPHQWESFLRVVYAHEVLRKAEIGRDGLLLNIVTGGVKTTVIAALIAWLRIAHDVQKHQRRYVPDFLVEYTDGRKGVIEIKDPSRIDSPDVQRKRKATEMWCQPRGMGYILATVEYRGGLASSA